MIVVEGVAAIFAGIQRARSFAVIGKSRVIPTLFAVGSGLGLAFFHYIIDAVNHHTARSEHTINHSPEIGWAAYVVIISPLIAQAIQLALEADEVIEEPQGTKAAIENPTFDPKSVGSFF